MIIDKPYYEDNTRISNSSIGWFLKKGAPLPSAHMAETAPAASLPGRPAQPHRLPVGKQRKDRGLGAL